MSLFDRAVAGLLPLVPKPVVGYFSRPYIAGPRLEDAVARVRELNARGMSATLDVLGEHISTSEEAEVPREAYLRALDEIARSRLDAGISVKLTQLGLKVDLEACYRNLRVLVARARELGNFVRIDMEDSTCTDDTLAAYRRLRSEGFDNTGVVLQAMLRRTMGDAEVLAGMKASVRLCKGIYVEPRKIAYRDGEIVNRNYTAVLERLLRAGCPVGIATHDERLVWEGSRLIDSLGVPRELVEFQMLLGVEEELRRIIVESGRRLRVYVPFGRQWYAYSVRRLRENPRIAGHVARGILSRNGGRAG